MADEYRLDIVLEGTNNAGGAVRDFERDIARAQTELEKLDKDIDVKVDLDAFRAVAGPSPLQAVATPT